MGKKLNGVLLFGNILFFLFSCFLYVYFSGRCSVIESECARKDSVLFSVLSGRLVLSYDNLYFWSKVFGVVHEDVFISQVILESGVGLNSELVRLNNNLVGMKVSRVRPSVNLDKCGVYSKYGHYIMCVYDYFLWQEHVWRGSSIYLKDSSEAGYLKFIGSVYAEDSLYLYKLRNVLKKLRDGGFKFVY